MLKTVTYEASANETFCAPPLSVAALISAGVDVAGAVKRLALKSAAASFEFRSSAGGDGVIVYDATAQTLTLAASLAAIYGWLPAGGYASGDLRLEWGGSPPTHSDVILAVRLELSAGTTALATDPASQTAVDTSIVTASIKGAADLVAVPVDQAQALASAQALLTPAGLLAAISAWSPADRAAFAQLVLSALPVMTDTVPVATGQAFFTPSGFLQRAG